MRIHAARGVSSGIASVRTKTRVHAKNTRLKHSVCSVQARSVSSDGAADGLEGRALRGVRFWESNVLRCVLEHLRAFDLVVLEGARPDNLDRVGCSAMST